MILQDLYLSTAIKLLLGFIVFIAQIQLTGRGNLAPNTIVDQLQNFVLGGIIGGVIYNTDITILQFLNVMIIWTLIVVISKYLSNHYAIFRKLIDGEPVLLIQNGQVLVENASKAGISANVLADKLRSSGAPAITEISRAIFERNGQLTVITKADAGLRLPVILDGRIDEDALKLIDKDEAWLIQQLHDQGYAPKQVYMATYTQNHLLIAAYDRPHFKPQA